METYNQLKQRHREDINNFPMVFAFNNEQFSEAMAKLGLTSDETDKIYSIGGGGYILRTEYESFSNLFTRHNTELESAFESDLTGEGFIFQALSSELNNHEFTYTGEVEPALEALGLDMDDIKTSPAMGNGFNLALKKQRKIQT